jgi:hypothetical protein
VPNPDLTIRNSFIAVRRWRPRRPPRGWRRGRRRARTSAPSCSSTWSSCCGGIWRREWSCSDAGRQSRAGSRHPSASALGRRCSCRRRDISQSGCRALRRPHTVAAHGTRATRRPRKGHRCVTGPHTLPGLCVRSFHPAGDARNDALSARMPVPCSLAFCVRNLRLSLLSPAQGHRPAPTPRDVMAELATFKGLVSMLSAERDRLQARLDSSSAAAPWATLLHAPRGDGDGGAAGGHAVAPVRHGATTPMQGGRDGTPGTHPTSWQCTLTAPLLFSRRRRRGR